eukprot:1181374-Prorocentrum_minimum.AAC.1
MFIIRWVSGSLCATLPLLAQRTGGPVKGEAILLRGSCYLCPAGVRELPSRGQASLLRRAVPPRGPVRPLFRRGRRAGEQKEEATEAQQPDPLQQSPTFRRRRAHGGARAGEPYPLQTPSTPPPHPLYTPSTLPPDPLQPPATVRLLLLRR